MYNSMNLVARRGHGCARPVGGARVVADVVGVGGVVARNNDTNAASAIRVGASTNRDVNIVAGGRDSGAPVVSAVQYQVRNQSKFADLIHWSFFSFSRNHSRKDTPDRW